MLSKIWTPSRDELQNLFDNSNTIVEVLSSLGLSPTSTGNRENLSKRMRDDNIDLSKHKINYREHNKKHLDQQRLKIMKSSSGVFFDNSSCGVKTCRSVILREKLLEYKCAWCGNIGEWNGNPLTLQLDHIDGNRKHNELSNYRFLCPNCHSQTETFGSKNGDRKTCITCDRTVGFRYEQCKKCTHLKFKCMSCKKRVHKDGIYCRKCTSIENLKKLPSLDYLSKCIAEIGWTATSEQFNVSRRTIGNWISRLSEQKNNSEYPSESQKDVSLDGKSC